MSLDSIKCVFEKYETTHLDAIYADINGVSEMTCEESRFLNGLVRYFKPAKILEVGVAAGASSCVLLNAVKDMQETAVHSVDISKAYYKNPSLLSGWKAKELFPDHARWNLYLGVDLAEIIENQIKGGIDFLLLDTAHVHPAETLSFLSAFPYLSGDAIVVLHDVNLFNDPDPGNLNSYATKLLMDSVVADKIIPNDFKDGYLYPNIAAFQINKDTCKYISDVVRSLFFPWGIQVSEKTLKATEKILQEKYPAELHALYLKSVKQNQSRRVTFKQRWAVVKRELRAMCIMCLPPSWVLFLRKIRKLLTGK